MAPPKYFGPYRVEKQMGQGGMGVVYRAVHDRTLEPVAVKVIASSVGDSERFRRRFDNEIETLKKLDHPNIVRIIGCGEERGELFYAMELVDGPSLQQHLRSIRRLHWSDTIKLGIEVCAALKHAHDVGVIHRDLKPANLLIAPGGRTKLTDFGIAKLFGASHVTMAGAVLGTADFMAPEQADAVGVTPRTDLYALGSVMYACLAGRSPFGGRQLTAVLSSLKHDAPPPLELINPDIPIELIELINHLLMKAPADRPPTAMAVGNRLRAMQIGLQQRSSQGEPNIAESVTLPEQGTLIADEPAAKNASKHSKSSESAKHAGGFGSNAHSEYASLEVSPSLIDSDRTHYRTIDESERRKAITPLTTSQPEESHEHGVWLSVIGLGVLLVALIGFAWWMLRPDSSDQLYARILQSREAEDFDALRTDAKLFLSLYAEDGRNEEVRDAMQVAERDATLRRLMMRAKLRGGSGELKPPELALVETLRLRESNPDEAQRRLHQWLIVFGDSRMPDVSVKPWVELARSTLAEWEHVDPEAMDRRAEDLSRWIAWGERNVPSHEKTAFFQSIVDLFQDKPWAAKPVEQARKLAHPPANSSSP